MLSDRVYNFTPTIVVAGVLALAAIYPVLRLARLKGVPVGLALLHCWAWIGVLSVTIVPDTASLNGMLDGTRPPSARSCYVGASPLDILSIGEARLNTLLFVPLGLFAVLAYRRPLAALVAGTLGSVMIEAAQLAINAGRQCDLLDLYANTAGTVVGVALGCLLLPLLKRRLSPLRNANLGGSR
ncbi:VanZ family protein [Streptomyces sp. NBC_01335]|uniref:VanZ family protein n=1 Tax=Streptomyces sp. NBC_01335 TaxID=2903828 RepID=UPI002E0EAE25|nr:VanZ family protein [Streptomyces sp. NBC_01335]